MQILYVQLPKYIFLYYANSLVPPHGGGIDTYGERTKAHWDKSPLGQKPTGQYPTGQKPTAKFGRVDKSPLL